MDYDPCATEIRTLAAHLFFAHFNSSLPSSSSLLYVTCTRYYMLIYFCLCAFFWMFYFWLFRHYGQNSVYVCVATAAVGSHCAIINIIFVTIGWLADCIQLYEVDSVHFWVSCIHSVWLFIYVFFFSIVRYMRTKTCHSLFAFNFPVASTQPNKWFSAFACFWFFGTFDTVQSVLESEMIHQIKP